MSLVSLGKALGIGLVLTAISAGSALAAYANTTVNVRSGPGTGYSVVATLHSGQRASITQSDGSWCFVRKVGRDGWVLCDALNGNDTYRNGGGYHYGYGYNRGFGYGYNGGYGYPGYGFGFGYPGIGLGFGYPGIGLGFGFGFGRGVYAHNHMHHH
jgi:hypothetical protein